MGEYKFPGSNAIEEETWKKEGESKKKVGAVNFSIAEQMVNRSEDTAAAATDTDLQIDDEIATYHWTTHLLKTHFSPCTTGQPRWRLFSSTLLKRILKNMLMLSTDWPALYCR